MMFLSEFCSVGGSGHGYVGSTKSQLTQIWVKQLSACGPEMSRRLCIYAVNMFFSVVNWGVLFMEVYGNRFLEVLPLVLCFHTLILLRVKGAETTTARWCSRCVHKAEPKSRKILNKSSKSSLFIP